MTDFRAGPVLTARPRCTLFPRNKGSFPRFNDLLGFSWPQRMVRFRSGQHWATAAMAWVIGTHLDGCKWIVSRCIKSRGYPQIIPVMDHFSIETYWNPWWLGVPLKETHMKERTLSIWEAQLFSFWRRKGATGSCPWEQLEHVCRWLSVHYPQTMEGKKWNRLTTNPQFPEQLW